MITTAVILLAITCIVAALRGLKGPTDADRIIAGDLVLFGMLGLICLIGIIYRNPYTFDILLIATLIGFLSSVSLARALTRGKR